MADTPKDAAALLASGSLVLRKATASDAETLAGFALRTFNETYAANSNSSDLEAYVRAAFNPAVQAEEIVDRAGSVTLAVHRSAAGEGLAGYTHLVEDQEAGSILLKRIYVDKAWKGSGLGRLLLDEATRESNRRGRHRLWLTVWERNTRAIAFYAKAGFRVAGETRFQLGDDTQTDLVMEIGTGAS
jgi:diamine N-acetyltransferase